MYIFLVLSIFLAFVLLLNNYYKNLYVEHCPEDKVAYSWDVYETWDNMISQCSKPLNCPKWFLIETQCSNLKYKNKQGEEYYSCWLYCKKEWWPPIF